jgi:DNA repair protein SbcC/Rad50
MLSRLFKSRARFDDPDHEVRRNAVAALSDDEAREFQDDLAELARADANAAVRRAAIGKLLDHARLEPFLSDPDPDIVRAAAEGIARDVDAGSLLHHPAVRAGAIRIARDVDSVAGLIGDVGFDAELIRLAVESKSPKVRVAVADKLMKEASLIELERVSRDKDKNVNRLARARLDEIKHARSDVERTARRAEELAHIVETQLRPDSDPLFAARLGVVKHDWQSNRERHDAAVARLAAHGVAASDLTPYSERFDAGIAAADASAAALARPAHEGAAPPAAGGDDAAFAAALEGLQQLFESIQRGELDGCDDHERIRDENGRCQEQWLAAADQRPPPDRLATRFHAITHALSGLAEATQRLIAHEADLQRIEAAAPATASPQSPESYEALWTEQRRARHTSDQLHRLLARIAWPGELPEPRRLRSAAEFAERLAAFDRSCHAEHDALLERLRALIGKLDAQINDGNLASAIGLEGEGRRILHSLPAGTARRMQGEFAALSARVVELKDWRTFATHPKREQFVAEMEALAATPLAPPQQAERIRQLRQAWNELGPVTNHPDRRLFERFNHAADTAFKPCREYFDAQAETRKFNLEQRRKICSELGHYLDGMTWENADWRAAERILYAARDEWRKFHPVDRSAGRKLQTQFDALTGRLHDKLKGEWDKNVAAKQAIIADANAVLDRAGNPREATEQIKALQRRWKDVGVVPRRIDQRLWKDFRSACDAVFNQRDAARNVERQVVESDISQAEALCEEFQHALDAADGGTAATEVLNEFTRRFGALPELPREAARRIEQRFRATERSYRLLLLQAQHAALLASVDRLYDIDAALAEIEHQVAAGTLDAAATSARLDAIDGLDRQRPAPFGERIAMIERADAAALTAAAATARVARRRLAIEIELVAGVETPPEFQQERLALQVERLNAGMKHRRVMDDAPLTIAERWCKAGPMTDADHALRDRFFRTCALALE